MANIRRGRINEEIMRELAGLTRTIKDPRVPAMISITRVEATQDMRYAKVYVSTLGDHEALLECIAGLKSAAGYLRRELASRLLLRYTPELVFEADESLIEGAHIMQLLEDIDKNAK
ncbi:MAG: 30S ribosome-binding factor RbfA [Clostridia bacterium]